MRSQHCLRAHHCLGRDRAWGRRPCGSATLPASSKYAGAPHRGKITDEEQRLVREHPGEIDERLAALGQRTISLDDPEHVERYGLEELAGQAG